MRRSTPFAVEIPRDSAWPWCVAALLLLAVLGLVAWLAVAADLSDRAVWAGLAAALVSLLLAVPAASVSAVRLRWDGSLWFLCPLDGANPVEASGRLRVMLDLSIAMLIRFSPDTPASGRVHWIPVRRGRLGTSWQPFRRTVYSSPPLPAGKTSGDGPHTETTRPD